MCDSLLERGILPEVLIPGSNILPLIINVSSFPVSRQLRMKAGKTMVACAAVRAFQICLGGDSAIWSKAGQPWFWPLCRAKARAAKKHSADLPFGYFVAKTK